MDLFKWVPRFIVFVFIYIIAWWIFVGVVAVKSISVIQKDGLKNVINRIWEGQK